MGCALCIVNQNTVLSFCSLQLTFYWCLVYLGIRRGIVRNPILRRSDPSCVRSDHVSTNTFDRREWFGMCPICPGVGRAASSLAQRFDTMALRRKESSSSRDADWWGKVSAVDTFPCKAFQVIQYCATHDPDVASWSRDGVLVRTSW
jgi:hypothetical protein